MKRLVGNNRPSKLQAPDFSRGEADLPDAIIVASSLAASSSVIATHDIELTKARSLIRVLSAEQVLKQLSSSPK